MKARPAALALMALVPGLALAAVATEAGVEWTHVEPVRETPCGRWADGDERAAVLASEGVAPSAEPVESVGAAAVGLRGALLPQIANEPYRSEFTFVRLQFDVGLRRGFRGGGRGEPPWAHDYPRAERNFARILSETTLLRPYMQGGNILTLDDPDLLDYPIAYMSEPGFLNMNETEALGLREYLLKGGFLIADDFRGGDWFNFEEQMALALPELQPVQLTLEDRVFDSFFRIESLEFAAPTFEQFQPEYWGYYENNDRENGRLMVIANYNNDIGDYWEWSDAGFLPIALSNEAYKLGVNYVIYALTH